MADVTSIAKASQHIGSNLNDLLTTPGIKAPELETKLDGLAQQEQQDVARAQSLSPPGRLREANKHLIEALQLRVSGLRGLADAFKSTIGESKDADKAGLLLAEQAQRLDRERRRVGRPVQTRRRRQSSTRRACTACRSPAHTFVGNPDLASTTTFAAIFKRIKGASTGGTAGGLHGTGIVSVTALPQRHRPLADDRDEDRRLHCARVRGRRPEHR